MRNTEIDTDRMIPQDKRDERTMMILRQWFKRHRREGYSFSHMFYDVCAEMNEIICEIQIKEEIDKFY